MMQIAFQDTIICPILHVIVAMEDKWDAKWMAALFVVVLVVRMEEEVCGMDIMHGKMDPVRWLGMGWQQQSANSGHPKGGCSKDRPQELSSDRLVDHESDTFIDGSLGSYKLMKKELKKDLDYVLVPPGVWDILYELYAGGPPLPRMILKKTV